MQVKELKQDGLNHELEVTVQASDIDGRIDAKLSEASKTMRIPGFRPGKVPLQVMKKRYGKAVMGEILEAAVNETSEQAMQEKKLTPAVRPKIEVKEFDEGKDLIYVMNVEVVPEFKVADYKGMSFEKLIAKPEEKAVNDALERVAENNQTSEEIKSDRATKDGDIVVIDFHGRTADDNKEHPGMHAHDHQLKLGSGQFIPGFEDQLIGKKKGDKVEVKVSFPEQYGAPELAGRDAIFDVDVKAIHESKAPKIDDEFAKKLGLDDLAALKTAVEEQLQKEFDQQSKMVLKKELLDQLDDKHDFDIPQSMEEMELNNITRQVEMENQQQGLNIELKDEEKEELRAIAQRRVRLGLVLSKIGNENNITVPDSELQKAVIMEAQKYPGQEKEVFDYYSKNRDALESLRAPVFEEKVVDFILELAEVKEKEVSAEDLMNVINAQNEEEENAAKGKKSSSTSKKTGAKKTASKAKSDDKGEEKDSKPKSAAKKPAAKKKA